MLIPGDDPERGIGPTLKSEGWGTRQAAHRQECLCHVGRLEGGATKKLQGRGLC